MENDVEQVIAENSAQLTTLQNRMYDMARETVSAWVDTEDTEFIDELAMQVFIDFVENA